MHTEERIPRSTSVIKKYSFTKNNHKEENSLNRKVVKLCEENFFGAIF